MFQKHVFILLFHNIIAWRLIILNDVTATTTIRLWHEMHCIKKISHDFTDMLSPERRKNSMHMAVVNHEEIRAIGLYEETTDAHKVLLRIAYPPQNFDGPLHLIKLSVDSDILINYDKLKSQPMWFCEAVWLQNQK